MKEHIGKLVNGEHLTREEARAAMDTIMDGGATDAQIAGLLISLKLKGETVDEIAGFVDSMRQHMHALEIADGNAVDGVGTGGDGAHSFNISTAAAIVTAACGITVAKHGNRSVSSKCGSADLLEATGGNIDPGPDRVTELIDTIGFGFMFAPRYHAAMKYAAGPRREIGQRTAFNILGPMTNPAGVKRQVTGVYEKRLMPLVADVLTATGSVHVIVMHSQDGLDEFSVSAPTDYIEVKEGKRTEGKLAPGDVGLSRHSAAGLTGGDAVQNLEILKRLLAGEKSACRDAVLFNAGAMMYVAGKADSIAGGVAMAGEGIDSGAASDKLDEWVESSNC